jgi:membrane-bound metal-dependent hydrolase YbcI (DUF457 family)
MARLRVHAGWGAVAGLGAYLGYKWFTGEKMTFMGAFASACGGAIIACLPDILEPATDPNHRALFHSITSLAAIAIGDVYCLNSENVSPDMKVAVFVASVAYGSHGVIDAMTPKMLPVVGL